MRLLLVSFLFAVLSDVAFSDVVVRFYLVLMRVQLLKLSCCSPMICINKSGNVYVRILVIICR